MALVTSKTYEQKTKAAMEKAKANDKANVDAARRVPSGTRVVGSNAVGLPAVESPTIVQRPTGLPVVDNRPAQPPTVAEQANPDLAAAMNSMRQRAALETDYTLPKASDPPGTTRLGGSAPSIEPERETPQALRNLGESLANKWTKGATTAEEANRAARDTSIDFLEAIPAAVQRGADQFYTGVTGAVDMLLGQPLQALGWENNPISNWNASAQAEAEGNAAKWGERIDNSGARAIADVGSQVVAALPDAALAFLSGGTSLAPQAAAQTTRGLQAARTAARAADAVGDFARGLGASGRVAGALTDAASVAIPAATEMLSNPQYWLSYAQTAGSSFNQARAEGADAAKATAYATVNGLLGAIVEMGGGIQTLPSELRQSPSQVRAWLDGMIDEGGEEIVQGVIDRLSQNVTGLANNALFSVADENAVFNPVTAAQEGAMGALVGGIVGGGQVLVNNAINNAAQRRAQRDFDAFLEAAGIDTQAQPEAVVAPESSPIQEQRQTVAPESQPIQEAIQESPVTPESAPAQEPLVEHTPVAVEARAGDSATPVNANVSAAANVMSDEQLLQEQQRNAEDIDSVRMSLAAAESGEYQPSPEALSNLQAMLPQLYARQTELAGIEQAKRVQRGEVSRGFDSPENHIDNRDAESVKGGRVAAFSFDHPQLHRYFADAAQDLQAMANYATTAEQYRSNRGSRVTRERNKRSVERAYSSELRDAMETGRLSKPQVMDACERIINNHGQENVLAAKRVELVLDDMLTNGYINADGVSVPPNEAYIAAKEQIAGARGEERAVERYLQDQEFANIGGEPLTADELAAQDAEVQRIRERYQNMRGQRQTASDIGPESSVGAAERGYSVGHAPDYATNQENSIRGALGDQYEGPGKHEVLHNRDSLFYARQRLDADYEGEVNDLRNKQEWDAVDTDVAYLIEQRLAREAMSGEDAAARNALREWTDLIRERNTAAGQALQARAKWANWTPEAAYADAVDMLYGDRVRRKMTTEQKEQVLRDVAEASRRLEVVADDDVAGTIDLIKALSRKRRTTGLFSDETSSLMNAALERVAQQEGGAEFLRNVAKSQIWSLSHDHEHVSFTERLRAVRTLNLLSKISTTLRNLVGNTVFDPLETISNNTGAALDFLLSTYTGQRTTAVDRSWFSAAKRQGSADALARSIIEVGLDADATGTENRYEQGGGRTFRMSGNFVERLFSTWEKYNGYMLTSTDEFAKGGIRAEAERGLRDLNERGWLRDNQAAQRALRQRESQSAAGAQGSQNILMPGTVVKALDRNNYGHIVSYNADSDTYTIHFESPQGGASDVDIPADAVVDAKEGGRVARAAKRILGDRATNREAAMQTGLSNEDYITQRAEEIAKQRTFQNDSMAADIMLGLRNVGNIIHYGDIGVGDVLLPFARVPANVGTQAINYSPAGLVNGVKQLYDVFQAADAGTLTAQQQAQAVTNIGRGLVGTTGIAAFAALALKGILNVAGSDDPDERTLDSSEGLSGTQLNLSALGRWIAGESTEWQDGDRLMNIGFLEPINAQMSMGAMIADSYLEDGTIDAADVANATLEGVMQSIIDLPAMSQIQEIQDAWESTEGEDMVSRIANAALSYAGAQVPGFIIPNIVAGIAAGLDDTQRAPYLGESALEDLVYQVMNDIPRLRSALPERVDNWGQAIPAEDNAVLNFLNNTILPGSLTTYNTNRINQAVRDLGNLPAKSAPSSFAVDGEDVVLNQEQKDAYQRVYGQTATSGIDALLGSATFNNLTKAEQSDVIDSIYSYATAVAKNSIDSRYELTGANADAQEFGAPAEYFLFKGAWKTVEDSKGADDAAFDAVMQDYSAMDAEQQEAVTALLGENSRFDDVVEAYEQGVEPAKWYGVYDKYKEINAQEGLSATDKATEFAHWLQTSGDYSAQERNLFRDQFAFYSMMRGDAERFDALRQAGLPSDQSYEVYDAVSALVPEAGETQVSRQQQYEAIIGLDALTDTEKLKALTEYEGAGKGDRRKFETAYNYGVSPERYVDMLALKDEGYGDTNWDGEGSHSYDAGEARTLVDHMLDTYDDMTREEAAVLWAMIMYNNKTKNPYGNVYGPYMDWVEG